MKNNEITSEKKEMKNKTLIDKLNNYIRNKIAF